MIRSNDINIILGSSSERRKILFSILFDKFQIIEPNCLEKNFNDPKKTVLENAKLKMNSIIEYLNSQNNINLSLTWSNYFIVTADTIVYKSSKIYPKPKSKDDAFFILKELNGKKHTVYSGVCLFLKNKYYLFHEKTNVYFNFLSDNLLKNYINTVEPYDAAGAYKIQGAGSALVKRVDGSITNVIGFPVEKFLKYYNKFICYSNEEVSIVSTTY